MKLKKVVFGVIGVMFLFLILVLWLAVQGVDSAGTAGWVQAIGSIAAVVGAWIAINHQIEVANEARSAEVLSKKREMAAICSAASKDVVDAFDYLVLDFYNASYARYFEEASIDRFETLAHTVSTLTNKDLVPQLFECLIQLQREVAYTLTAVRQYNSEKIPPTIIRLKNAEHRLASAKNVQQRISALEKNYALFDD